jgi:hypothetical protein
LQPADFFVSLRPAGARSGSGRGQTAEQQLAIFRHIVSDRLNVKN